LKVKTVPAPMVRNRLCCLTKMTGFYCIVLWIEFPLDTVVGRLGPVILPRGYYVYTGSAQSGIEARVARHLRADKRRHWHLDYIMPPARAVEVWAGGGTREMECRCAQSLLRHTEAVLAVPGFGSSDCRCDGHLVWLPSRPTKSALERDLDGEKPAGWMRTIPLPGISE
jgi:Uri superfamily endonuclease